MEFLCRSMLIYRQTPLSMDKICLNYPSEGDERTFGDCSKPWEHKNLNYNQNVSQAFGLREKIWESQGYLHLLDK